MSVKVRVGAELKSIENSSVVAYRQHIKDRSIDYHIVVKKEAEQARQSLRDKARQKALKKRHYSVTKNTI